MSHIIYDNFFYSHVDEGALRSAEYVVPLMKEVISAKSLLDVGCGFGAWVHTWKKYGIDDVVGVDYLLENPLMAEGLYFSADLSKPLDLGRKFDLITCLEVAEHLSPSSTVVLLDNISRHSDAVFFSAASPGQGGLNHINEQPLRYWMDKFAEMGYNAFDPLRPELVKIRGIEPWYRYNLILFARSDALMRLSRDALLTKIVSHAHLKNYESYAWAFRRAIIRCLPRHIVDNLARISHRYSSIF